ncbi:hypothetical protein DXA36_16710 [Eisenbergiella sp. OF01-20]|nr:hypothetical protein DXA36_16710 [Eisenbergiella sp. OF01-20]
MGNRRQPHRRLLPRLLFLLGRLGATAPSPEALRASGFCGLQGSAAFRVQRPSVFYAPPLCPDIPSTTPNTRS